MTDTTPNLITELAAAINDPSGLTVTVFEGFNRRCSDTTDDQVREAFTSYTQALINHVLQMEEPTSAELHFVDQAYNAVYEVDIPAKRPDKIDAIIQPMFDRAGVLDQCDYLLDQLPNNIWDEISEAVSFHDERDFQQFSGLAAQSVQVIDKISQMEREELVALDRPYFGLNGEMPSGLKIIALLCQKAIPLWEPGTPKSSKVATVYAALNTIMLPNDEMPTTAINPPTRPSYVGQAWEQDPHAG